MAGLSPADQSLVTLLVGILRIADGLDRDHQQAVDDVVVYCEPGCVRLLVRGDGDLELCLRYGRSKANVFAAAVQQDVLITRVNEAALHGHEAHVL